MMKTFGAEDVMIAWSSECIHSTITAVTLRGPTHVLMLYLRGVGGDN